MGKTINPGIGELSDRLSILCLKILFGRHSGKEIAHFETEKAAILTAVRTRTLNGKWFEAYSELAAVNAALWHAEDALREFRGSGSIGSFAVAVVDGIVKLAFQIQSLNDERADLVARLNKDAGESVGGEKL